MDLERVNGLLEAWGEPAYRSRQVEAAALRGLAADWDEVTVLPRALRARLAACRRLNDPRGFGLGARQIAISTAGWVPGIERLAGEPLQVKLALSLHAPDDELRRELMPVTKRFPLDRLMAACRDYRARTR